MALDEMDAGMVLQMTEEIGPDDGRQKKEVSAH